MVINGKIIADRIFSGLKREISNLGFVPKLIDIYVGGNSVIESYVNIKGRRAREIGMGFEAVHFPETATQEEIENKIRQANSRREVCGIIVQLPLPQNLDKKKILDAISPALDVDAIGTVNSEKFISGQEIFLPPTAGAILQILEQYKIGIGSAKILVIGAGDLVGKPVAVLLKRRGAQIKIADSQTRNLKELSLAADIIISGAGSPKLVKADMVKEGAIVIDAGTSESGGSIAGDVDFETVAPKCSLITPVPGGVGPVTVAMLLRNALMAAKARH